MTQEISDEHMERVILGNLQAKRKTKHFDLNLTKRLHEVQRKFEREYGVLGAELDGLGKKCADCGAEDFEWTWCEHENKGEEIVPLCDSCVRERITQGWYEEEKMGWSFIISDYAEDFWYGEYLSGAGDW